MVTMPQIVIIDDEQNGVEIVVEIMLKFLLFNVNIIGTANNFHKDGIELINKIKTDIVFLNIKMPIIYGLTN